MSVSALDLPQVWQKPAFPDLLAALQKLRVEPPMWNAKVSRVEILREQDTSSQHRREVTAYLSTIVGSGLAWIDDEEDREAIWTEASQRFSERSGRAGMGEMIRRWPFENNEYSPFELAIREPAMTGDNIGLKTWGSSYLLAQMLHTIRSTSFSHLLPKQNDAVRPVVLELGSGTGLLGLAAAAIWQTHVILSDLPEIMPNLMYNADCNRQILQDRGGSVESGALTWGGEEGDEIDPLLFGEKNQFKMIIVADPLYNDDHPGLLAGTIDDQLSLDGEARAMIMVPQRDETTVMLRAILLERLASKGTPVVCLEQSVVSGQDDWGEDGDEEAGQVSCWLGIFSRRTPLPSI